MNNKFMQNHRKRNDGIIIIIYSNSHVKESLLQQRRIRALELLERYHVVSVVE